MKDVYDLSHGSFRNPEYYQLYYAELNPLNRKLKGSHLFCILVMMLAAATPTAHAQYQIESWTTDNGLPQNTVSSIVQTLDGYLWLATLDGLVRYDGVRFTVFNKSNSKGIGSNRFTRMVVDASSDL